MERKMQLTNLSSYVSQKNWKDTDKEVECTVEAVIAGVKMKAVFNCVDPLTALEKCRDNPELYTWIKKDDTESN